MPGRINPPQLHSHTGGAHHSGISELMASCVCRSFRSAVFGFMDGVGEAAAATPSGVSLLLLCPRCCGIVSDVMVEQGGFIVQKYAQTVVCASDSWKMVHPVLGLWLVADSSGFLLRRRCRAGVSDLEFDGVSGDMLPRSDSFNGNGFASGKLLSRSVKLLISDGAASSSGEEVIYFLFLWWPLRWCRRKGTGAGILHRIILCFQSCNVGAL